MRLYSYINIMITGFSNTYIVANEKLNEAIIIDPGKITPRIIEKLESKNFKIQGILITHNHETHVQGLRTLNKTIYYHNTNTTKFIQQISMPPTTKLQKQKLSY